ncbi:hypothetical protein ACVWZ6_008968 [Bradyrhizobium sp. GM6.1]
MAERAARHAGERADQHTDKDRDQHRGETDRERDAPAIDHAGEDILPEIVGAKGMGQRRPLHARHDVDVVDLDPPDKGADHHRQDQNEEQERADHGKLVAAIAPPRLAPGRVDAPLSGGRCEGQASHKERPR